MIHNPTAGGGGPTARDLRRIVADAGFQVRYQSTKKDWKKAMRSSADLIIAAGGDGTLSKVMLAARGGKTPVALLPLGTANNIGRSFRVLGEVQEVIASWRDAEPLTVDLGHVQWGDAEQYFVEGCGGGLFAAAIDEGKEKIEEGAHFLGHELDRALIFLLKHLEHTKAVAWQVDVDGVDHSGEYYGVEILNIRFAGPSVPVASRADMSDGKLDVALIGEGERTALIEYLNNRLDHAAAEMPDIRLLRGTNFMLAPSDGSLRVDDNVAVEDGSYRTGRVTFRVGVEAGSVMVIAPPRTPG